MATSWKDSPEFMALWDSPDALTCRGLGALRGFVIFAALGRRPGAAPVFDVTPRAMQGVLDFIAASRPILDLASADSNADLPLEWRRMARVVAVAELVSTRAKPVTRSREDLLSFARRTLDDVRDLVNAEEMAPYRADGAVFLRIRSALAAIKERLGLVSDRDPQEPRPSECRRTTHPER